MQALRARCSFLALLILAALPAGAAQREQVSTRAKLDLTPFEDTGKRAAELIPVLAGNEVLVTSTLRLFAFDAHTTELRWSAGPPRGWEELEPAARDELFLGVDARQSWIAPAAGERVAVAALQVPLSRYPAEEQISTPLPERRLFAFELGTGRPLWNHAPPPEWDGASGSLALRMSLCASPTVIGDRVLVPWTSDESSIDYHVECYELATGAPVWSTFVVRGQVERNMFGMAVREFAAAPLVDVPARDFVLAQTGLGQVAALDLGSGQVLWRTEYAAIELPKSRSYSPPRRDLTWRTTPPIVVGDVVLTTPPDSRTLLAFDLEDGRVLWSITNWALNRFHASSEKLEFDHLIGSGEDVLYLGGAKVSALAKPGGWRSRKKLEPLWTERVALSHLSGRAQLAGDELYLPGPIECLVFDRENGKSRESHATAGTPRGLLVTDEALFVLAYDGLKRIER